MVQIVDDMNQTENAELQTVPQTDTELESKVKKATERVSENMHIVANEPSLAFFRLQEHVRKSLSPMVEKRLEVAQLHHQLQGRCYDAEYAVGAVRSIHNSSATFANIQEVLKNAIFSRQQLRYEESRRQRKEPSVYKRLSAHLSLDLPDLPELSDAWRETASRVESVLAQARAGHHHSASAAHVQTHPSDPNSSTTPAPPKTPSQEEHSRQHASRKQ